MTIEVITNNGDKFNVEYEAERPPMMDYVSVNIIKICIGVYELEYFGFKILHSELFEEIVSKCKEHFSKVEDADDLKTVTFK